MVRDHVDEVLINCVTIWTPEQFIEHNEVRWGLLRDGLRRASTSSDSMPFFFKDVLEVVRSEVPHLFRVDASMQSVPSSSARSQASKAISKPQIAASLLDSELARTLVAMPLVERQAQLEEKIMLIVKDLAGEDSVAVETPLMDAGIDSLAATELVSRLSELSSLSLAPTLMFEYPSPR